MATDMNRHPDLHVRKSSAPVYRLNEITGAYLVTYCL